MKTTTPWALLKKRALAAVILALTASAAAQHYPAGSEGILAASVPPPGLYLRDYNAFYTADRFPGGPADFSVFVYANAPRLIWVTGEKFLGADYGVDLVAPVIYSDVKAGGMKDSRFGLGDIEVKPAILSWHTKQLDLCLAYGIWAPTGSFDPNHLANPGKGFWTQMPAAGITWYPDDAKTWAVSLMNWYEINTEQKDTHLTPGQTYTLEWGLSKTVSKGLDLGLVGYVQQQTTASTGPATSDSLSHVFSVGPEISYLIPKCYVIASLRYLREFAAKGRPEGNTITLTLTKRF